MANFTTMKASVYAVLRDSEKVFVLDAEVGEWLNEAYLDIVARTGILKKSVPDTFDTAGRDTLPTDFLRETALYIATDTATIFDEPEFTNDEIFLSWKNSDSTPPNTLARVFNEKLETYPAAASKAYTMEYIYKPAVLTGTDVPVIPEELHIRLINYARAQAKWKEGEEGEGDRYFALYTEGLASAPTGQYRARPGPFNFLPAPSYWESWDE